LGSLNKDKIFHKENCMDESRKRANKLLVEVDRLASVSSIVAIVILVILAMLLQQWQPPQPSLLSILRDLSKDFILKLIPILLLFVISYYFFRRIQTIRAEEEREQLAEMLKKQLEPSLQAVNERLELLKQADNPSNIIIWSFSEDDTLKKEITRCNEVLLLGLTLRTLVNEYYYVLRENVQKGTKIRAIVLDQDNVDMDIVVKAIYEAGTPDDFIHDFKVTRNQLIGIKDKAIRPDNVQLRLSRYIPSFGAKIFPSADRTGIAYIEIYCYQSEKGAVPKFVVTEEEHFAWFQHFQQQFELIWNDSKDCGL
jgi:hypothetical protein